MECTYTIATVTMTTIIDTYLEYQANVRPTCTYDDNDHVIIHVLYM